MTKFLIKLFVKNNADVTDPAVRGRYASLAAFTGIVLNLLLFAGKLTAGLLAASVAVVADAFNNMSDAGSAVVTLIGFRLALKPVDKGHPLGHGRLEYIAGFIVDLLIILVGAELFKSSFEKILSPSLPSVSVLTYALLSAAILVNLSILPQSKPRRSTACPTRRRPRSCSFPRSSRSLRGSPSTAGRESSSPRLFSLRASRRRRRRSTCC